MASAENASPSFRAGLSRTTELKPKPARKRPGAGIASKQWRAAILERNLESNGGYGICEASGEMLLPSWSAHHILEASSLAAMKMERFLWVPENGMALNPKPHMDHHAGVRRILRCQLPDYVWVFAAELDEIAGCEWATSRLERSYPEGDR